MTIYTFNPVTNKHLYCRLPGDWSKDDIDFFTKGKDHLQIVEERKKQLPESIKKEFKEEEERRKKEREEREKEEEIIKEDQQLALSKLENLDHCPDHPTYIGLRLGNRVRNCPKCMEIYNLRKAAGIREERHYN